MHENKKKIIERRRSKKKKVYTTTATVAVRCSVKYKSEDDIKYRHPYIQLRQTVTHNGVAKNNKEKN